MEAAVGLQVSSTRLLLNIQKMRLIDVSFRTRGKKTQRDEHAERCC